jgi:hypothetical protein
VKKDDRPLYVVVIRAKRYVKARRDPDGSFDVVDWTVHGLSGGVLGPPALLGRDTERRPNWTRPVAEHALARALAGGAPLVFDAPWDHEVDDPWPHLHRVQLATPDALSTVPPVLGCHPFTWVLEAVVDNELSPTAAALWTLDPGGTGEAWKTWPWFDSAGRQHPVTTRNDEPWAVRLERLADKAWRWAVPMPFEDPGLVEIDPDLIRRVGRGGAIVDAQLADPNARVVDHEVVYSEGDALGFVRNEAERLGPTALARRYHLAPSTARHVSARRAPSVRTIAAVLAGLGRTPERVCALADCENPVGRSNALYCSRAHAKLDRDRRYRRRKSETTSKTQDTRRRRATPNSDPDADLACPGCGTVLLGKAAQGPCPVCSANERSVSP